MGIYSKQTYSEICEFLELLGGKYINKIPIKLLNLFENNKSKDYIPHINPDIPIIDQSLNKDTLTLIAILNLKYWCDDKNEIARLKMVYSHNENLYQEKLKINIDTNDIFKKHKKQCENSNATEIVIYKLPLYKKLLIKIKNIFKK